jgi:predicted DNA-binding protein
VFASTAHTQRKLLLLLHLPKERSTYIRELVEAFACSSLTVYGTHRRPFLLGHVPKKKSTHIRELLKHIRAAGSLYTWNS